MAPNCRPISTNVEALLPVRILPFSPVDIFMDRNEWALFILKDTTNNFGNLGLLHFVSKFCATYFQ
jgi:hypothetical protein